MPLTARCTLLNGTPTNYAAGASCSFKTALKVQFEKEIQSDHNTGRRFEGIAVKQFQAPASLPPRPAGQLIEEEQPVLQKSQASKNQHSPTCCDSPKKSLIFGWYQCVEEIKPMLCARYDGGAFIPSSHRAKQSFTNICFIELHPSK